MCDERARLPGSFSLQVAMIRRALLWTITTVEAAAIAAVGACVLVRGLILEEPRKPKRDPFTGRPEEADWN